VRVVLDGLSYFRRLGYYGRGRLGLLCNSSDGWGLGASLICWVGEVDNHSCSKKAVCKCATQIVILTIVG
jgi:hypothetical protein